MEPATKKHKSLRPKEAMEAAISLEDGPENPWLGKEYTARYHSFLKVRRGLPVNEERKKFLKLFHKHQVLVFVGETGSGKTTQIPQFVAMDALTRGDTTAQIACTQPRRVAAMSVAERVAQEMDVKLGNEVGYAVRFDNNTNDRTRLRYMTDGMLLREAMTDPDMTRYSCIIIDEAHERTLSTDILIGLLKLLILRRSDLKVIIMSATLDAEKFQTYFGGAPLLAVPGRTFPVEIFYTANYQDDYLASAVRTVLQIHGSELSNSGDVLVFLTGEEEIEDACRKIRLECDQLRLERPGIGPVDVYPLYGSLPPNQQQQIFKPAPQGGRKVVVGTNIAETSITIDGVVYVIDPGFSKQKVYNPRIRVESLLVSPISKASAQQRAGRAGRTLSGKCFRLYTQDAYKSQLIEQSYPEILRSNLSNTILELKKLGVDDLVHFDFIDPPAPETMMRALEELHYLRCIDDNGNLTELGRQCSLIPLDPTLAVTLISSSNMKCSEEVLTIVAMLSAPQVFVRPHNARRAADDAKMQFADETSDHITLLNVFQEYEAQEDAGNGSKWAWENYLNHRALQSARSVRQQLRGILMEQGHELVSTLPTHKHFESRIKKALITGFFMQVSKRQGTKKTLRTVKDNQDVVLHPSTVVAQRAYDFVLYHEFVLTTTNYIRTVTCVKPEWLLEVAPDYFDPKSFERGSADVMLALEHAERRKEKKK